jgi:pyruvate,water dikinase
MIGSLCFRYYSDFIEKDALECEKSETKWGFQRKTDDSFCRTVEEGEKYWQKWPPQITPGENGLYVYVMIEIPSNVILADEFASLLMDFLSVPMI